MSEGEVHNSPTHPIDKDPVIRYPVHHSHHLSPLPWGGDGVGDVGARHVGSQKLPWVILMFPAKADNVIDLERGGPHVMVPLAGHNVHLRPFHWETICFITSIKQDWGIGRVWKKPSISEFYNLKMKNISST